MRHAPGLPVAERVLNSVSDFAPRDVVFRRQLKFAFGGFSSISGQTSTPSRPYPGRLSALHDFAVARQGNDAGGDGQAFGGFSRRLRIPMVAVRS